MPSLYAQYLAEGGRDHILEMPYGFSTYRYLNEGKSVYIVDVYVVPEQRNLGRCREMSDIIAEEAKNMGCTEMLGTVAPSMPWSTASLKMQLACGMKLHSAATDAIILRKDL